MDDLKTRIYECIRNYVNEDRYRIYKHLLEETKISFTIKFDDNTEKKIQKDYYEMDSQISYYEDLIRKNTKINIDNITKSVVSISDMNEWEIVEHPFLDILDIDKDYYSAYYNINKDKFENKNFIWFTPQFDQALLHLFDEIRNKSEETDLQPTIFRFRLKKPVFIINSKTDGNEYILRDLIPRILREKIMDILNENHIEDFRRENNKYVLIILEQLNKFIENDNLKIYGYKNFFDQNEIALINFNELVDKSSIKQSNIISGYFCGNYTNELNDTEENECFTINFPVNENEMKIKLKQSNYTKSTDPRLQLNFVITQPITRMIMKEQRNIIVYQDFDTGENIEWRPPNLDDYFRKKYLKYKQKYLQLKKKLNLE